MRHRRHPHARPHQGVRIKCTYHTATQQFPTHEAHNKFATHDIHADMGDVGDRGAERRRNARNERNRRYRAVNAAAISTRRGAQRATSADSVNARRRAQYPASADAINSRRRSQHTTRTLEMIATSRQRRATVLNDKRRAAHDIFQTGDESAALRSVVLDRLRALEEARRDRGITAQAGHPCAHCGAELFARESRGICCKNGKFILPRLPSLPPSLQELYDSSEMSAQRFRKESRTYNCRCNFASLNVEDGELKKLFGDHLLSVQGR